MKGYLFITRSGYDPQRGKHIKDPYLGDTPTLGACRTNIRRYVTEGDHIFVVSGKIKKVPQYVIGGFEVAEKLNAIAAYHRYPHLRLRELGDGQLDGNIIVNSKGKQHYLDNHSSFERRIEDYIVGRDPVVLTSDNEIDNGRQETLEVLRTVLSKTGDSPFNMIGRGYTKLDEDQIMALRQWLYRIRAETP